MNIKVHSEIDQQSRRRQLINDHIGNRIRLQRNNVGLSAVDLGKSLNVRYRQVHFYERGDNQVTSSSLYKLSQALNVPISFFFDGVSSLDIEIPAFLETNSLDSSDTVNIFSVKDIKEIEQEVRSLVEIFYKIEDKTTRNILVSFLKDLGKRY